MSCRDHIDFSLQRAKCKKGWFYLGSVTWTDGHPMTIEFDPTKNKSFLGNYKWTEAKNRCAVWASSMGEAVQIKLFMIPPGNPQRFTP